MIGGPLGDTGPTVGGPQTNHADEQKRCTRGGLARGSRWLITGPARVIVGVGDQVGTLRMDTQSACNDERLFSIFETSDESALREQCMSDLASWGFDSFQCRQKTKRILENGQRADDEHPRPIESVSSDGVTRNDHAWYWGLPTVARAAMRFFDDEIRNHMWLVCHARNICMEDLERDMARSLPTFANDSQHNDSDSPLPHELRRRFQAFIAEVRADEDKWRIWSNELAEASSMNSLIRKTIRDGNM
jgi:hypothetical protein